MRVCVIDIVIRQFLSYYVMQGSGSDEIVVCAWDGMTYIVDQQRNSVRFQFEQNVSAFTAGIL